MDDRISAELSVSILPEGPTYPLIMSDTGGAPKEEGPTVEASHHPEIKVDPPDVKETTDEKTKQKCVVINCGSKEWF